MSNLRRRRPTVFILSGIALLICSCATSRSVTPDDSRDRYYEIAGHRMHMSVDGSGPTVIFSAGLGVADPREDFVGLTRLVAKNATTVVYDRAGFGKSEPTSLPRDIDSVVGEMDALFTAAGLAPPFILVGHSIASFEALRYAQLHPEKTKAVVLIDGTPPESVIKDYKGPSQRDRDQAAWGFANKYALAEMEYFRANAAKILEAGGIGNIPLSYIFATARSKTWNEYQALFDSFSTAARAVPIADAEHYLHRKYPELIASEILRYL